MSNRYSLISTYHGKSSVIKIRKYDKNIGKVLEKEKLSLASIDLYTSHFCSDEDFNRYFHLPVDAKLSIVYQSNNQQKEIPCIYSDNLFMRYFANASMGMFENEIQENDEYFLKLVRRLLFAVCKSSIKKYVMRDPNINVYVKDKIADYLDGNGDEKFILTKLKLELQKYKNLRSVVCNLIHYEKENATQILNFTVPEVEECLPEQQVCLSNFIPNDLLLEPPFPPNSEEERNYNRYLENLPYDFCCHEEYPRLTKKR